jgi:hypothetical protein
MDLPSSQTYITDAEQRLEHTLQSLGNTYRSQSWEVRETMSLGYPKLMVN